MADIDHQATHDLAGSTAAEKLKDLGERCRTCLFTSDPTGYPGDTTPMSVQGIDDDGTLWFISSKQSARNNNILGDPRVELSFQNEGKYEYLTLHGRARIHTDRATIDAHWTKLADAWFEGGKDDPRVSILSVKPDGGHYWETKAGKLVSFAKMSYAALTGSEVDDGGRDGQLNL